MRKCPVRRLDIGTGTYTIMAQVAAETLGLPIENVTIKLGDSTLPQSPVEGGLVDGSFSSRTRLQTPPGKFVKSC